MKLFYQALDSQKFLWHRDFTFSVVSVAPGHWSWGWTGKVLIRVLVLLFPTHPAGAQDLAFLGQRLACTMKDQCHLTAGLWSWVLENSSAFNASGKISYCDHHVSPPMTCVWVFRSPCCHAWWHLVSCCPWRGWVDWMEKAWGSGTAYFPHPPAQLSSYLCFYC